MGYTLLDNRNPNGDHFYPSRLGIVLAIVVHVTAGLEDLDGVDDHSAENTAAYATTTDREVSWHSGSDTDSWVDLLPGSCTAWHVVSYNSRTYGHEISKQHTDWSVMPAEWVTKTLTVAARGVNGHGGLRAIAEQLGIPLRKATRAELDHAIRTGGAPVGFISHAELQPKDRTDPGMVRGVDTFPWVRFVALLQGTEEDDMPFAVPNPVQWPRGTEEWGVIAVPPVDESASMGRPDSQAWIHLRCPNRPVTIHGMWFIHHNGSTIEALPEFELQHDTYWVKEIPSGCSQVSVLYTGEVPVAATLETRY